MTSEKEFIILLNQHQNIIHKICSVYQEQQADREDLFQEITLQAWKSFGSFRKESKFSTWLYRVSLNTAITFYRKGKKSPALLHTDQFSDQADNESDKDDQFKAMYKAIGELSKIDKALVMLYMDEYTYQEIAGILGISTNNVAVKINRIKIRLRETTQKHYQL